MDRPVWNADRTEGALTFTVRDTELGTIRSCIATWHQVTLPNAPRNPQHGNPHQGQRGQDIHIFNVANGSVTLARIDSDTGDLARVASEPNAHRLNEDCEYDADTPSNTPFALGNALPALGDPARAADVFIGDNPALIGVPEPNRPYDIYEPGDIRFRLGQTTSVARARIRFYFYAEDAYSAEDKRARVASGEDGAWADLREVEVRDGWGQVWIPASTTAWFRGKARVSTSRDALTPGDDRVYIRSPDEDLQVHYHSAIGEADGAIGGDDKPKRSARAPRRRVSVEFANAPREHGDSVVFYISDRYLETTRTCAAVWEDTPRAAPGVQTYWRLADGGPFPQVFTLEGANCAYDAATPIILPALAAIMTLPSGQSNVMENTSIDDANWRIAFRNEVPVGSALRVMFRQTLPDVFPASARIAHVYSSSDRAGEWVAIREVASKTDASAAGASHLFRGEIEISAHESSRATGDGKVFVRPTSRLWVAYHDIDNAETELGRKSQALALLIPTPTPTPVPTPIPAASRLTLALAAAAFSALTAYALLARARRNPPHPHRASP